MKSLLSLAVLFFTFSAQATNPNINRANFWLLHFDANYGGQANLPVAYVQAHIGEAEYNVDYQNRPNWDNHQALVTLNRVGDHFFARGSTEHNESPYNTGGYRGAVVQYHYFLKGEESQIDTNNPYANGHWTSPVVYEDPSYGQAQPAYKFDLVLYANGSTSYEQLKQSVAGSLAADADHTSVIEIKWDFAD